MLVTVGLLRRLADLLSLASYFSLFANTSFVTGFQTVSPLSLIGSALLLVSTGLRYAPVWLPATRTFSGAAAALMTDLKESGLMAPESVGLGAWKHGTSRLVPLLEKLLTTSRSARMVMLGMALVPRFLGLCAVAALRAWRARGAVRTRAPAASKGAVVVKPVAKPWLLTLSIALATAVATTSATSTAASSSSLSPYSFVLRLRMYAEALHIVALAHESSRLHAATPSATLSFLTLQTLAFAANASGTIVSKRWASAEFASVAAFSRLLSESRTLGFMCIRSVTECTKTVLHLRLQQNWAFLLTTIALAALVAVPANEKALIGPPSADTPVVMGDLSRIYFATWAIVAFGGGLPGTILFVGFLQLAIKGSGAWEQHAAEPFRTPSP